jgi:hypothetical protein
VPRCLARYVPRIRELRDAHLTREQIKASAAAEGITILYDVAGLDLRPHLLVAAMLRILVADVWTDNTSRERTTPGCSHRRSTTEQVDNRTVGAEVLGRGWRHGQASDSLMVQLARSLGSPAVLLFGRSCRLVYCRRPIALASLPDNPVPHELTWSAIGQALLAPVDE